ncbi:hypothetical protein K440DRAFT_190265 [Wilcoxina mikolae CBS 423.85]|nr:hypothetical protein K440DRAFT_190265 [Wilcoxina mikolae CBS 423.85]
MQMACALEAPIKKTHLSRTPKLNLAPLPPNNSPPPLSFITINNFLRKLITIKPQPTITKMPQSYIFTFKEGADKDKFKKDLAAAGGKVTHEYSLISALSYYILIPRTYTLLLKFGKQCRAPRWLCRHLERSR